MANLLLARMTNLPKFSDPYQAIQYTREKSHFVCDCLDGPKSKHPIWATKEPPIAIDLDKFYSLAMALAEKTSKQ